MKTSAVIAHDVCSVMVFCCKEWLFELPARPIDLFSEFPHTKPMLTGCFLIYLHVVFSNRVNFFLFLLICVFSYSFTAFFATVHVICLHLEMLQQNMSLMQYIDIITL